MENWATGHDLRLLVEALEMLQGLEGYVQHAEDLATVRAAYHEYCDTVLIRLPGADAGQVTLAEAWTLCRRPVRYKDITERLRRLELKYQIHAVHSLKLDFPACDFRSIWTRIREVAREHHRNFRADGDW